MKRMLSGIKPTGDLNIGHYIGAIRQFVEMQKEYESFVFVADLHSLTINPDPKELREDMRKMVGLYLACGLDPKHTTLFLQSENIYHPMLSYVLECNANMGEMSRMTQYKDKSHKLEQVSINLGLFTYPVLMTADILLYDADVVPVGEDQKQHVELARNIAERFNFRYGETFKVPEPVIPETGARIKDLQDPTKKMSKSDMSQKGCIQLLDDLDLVRKKIMSSVTDSDSLVKYDVENKPGVSNLMSIYSAFTDKEMEEIEEEFKGENYGTFKSKVADAVVNFLEPLQKRYDELVSGDEIDRVLDEGLKKAEAIAKVKAFEAYQKVGVGRY